MRKSKKRIHGNDRALMFICRDIRRRWMQYGENRKSAKKIEYCERCRETMAEEWDHVEPVGPRPRVFHGLGEYTERMFYLKCQALCKECHQEKSNYERKQRNKRRKENE